MNEIVQDMIHFYIADSGLGRIDPYPQTSLDHWIAPNGVYSVNNENGILFLAYMLTLGDVAHQKLKIPGASYTFYYQVLKAAGTVRTLERIPGTRGLYNRQPGGYNQRQERHDNYVGICAISVLNGDTETPQAMIDWAWSHWFCFNNVEPEKFNKEQIRQPGEVALYYIAAGKEAPFIFWIWLLAGIIIGIKKKSAHTPQLRLTWLRLWVIDTMGVKGWVKRKLYNYVRKMWFKNAEKFGGLKGIFGFPENHPIKRFVEIIS
jgi:hypothetical protein